MKTLRVCGNTGSYVLYFRIQNTPYYGGDTMAYYKIKVISISGEKIIKVPEREMNTFLDTAKRMNWEIKFVG